MPKRVHSFSTRGEVVAQARAKIADWDGSVEHEVQRIARGHVRHMLQIEKAKTYRQAHARFQNAISSPACRLAAALLSWKRDKRPFAYFRSIAEEANVRRSQNAVLHVFTRVKADGKARPISSFGHVDGTKQVLLRDILIAKFGYSPFEHARAGRGRDTVVREILSILEEGGAEQLIEADMKDCFPSVNRRALSAFLKLPSSVVRNTVAIGPNTSVTIHDNKDHHISIERVRAGLPQGSRVSPFIMSKIVEDVLRQFDGPLAVSFVDNLWLGAMDTSEAAAKKDALAVVLRRHPAGPFTLKYMNSFTFDSYNDVLGYWVRRQTPGSKGVARVTPSPWAMQAFQQKAAAKLTFHRTTRDLEPVVDQLTSDWCNSLGAWGGRRGGQSLAFGDVYEHALPHQKSFLGVGRRFNSFRDLQQALTEHAYKLPLNPHYRPKGWQGEFPSVSPH